MKTLLAVVLVCLLATLGCTVSEESPQASTPESDSPIVQQVDDEVKQQEVKAQPSIPADVSYTISETDVLPGVKRSLTVRLNKKVSEAVLRAIALELRGRDSRSFDRTFIVYYLPGMDLGAGAWATTHFNPTLDVKILGLTSGEETVLKKASPKSGREVLGEWIDDRPYVASRITLYRENGALHVSFAFKDGSVWDNVVRETSSSLGRRFDPIEGSASGDHWIIDSSGNLLERDSEGHIATAHGA